MFKGIKGPHELEPAVILPGCSPDLLFYFSFYLQGGLCFPLPPGL